MAEITFTIAASGEGDFIYTSISAYEVNEATNLVSAGDNHVVNCENFEDGTAFNVSGFTTSASSNIVIQAETAHLSCGDYLENAYRLTTSSTVAGKIGDNHVHLIGLTLRKEDDNDNYSAACSPMGSATSVIVEKCILLNEEDTTSGASPAAIRNSGNSHIEATFRNCVAISKRRGFNTLANGDWTLDNCTIIAGTNGTQISGNNDVVARNCYANGGSGDDWASAITTTTCASSDSSGDTGLTSIAYSTANFVSVTAGAEDLRLVVGATALIGGGTDLSSDFTDDIDGTTRSSWDVGADEFESAGEVVELGTSGANIFSATSAVAATALNKVTSGLSLTPSATSAVAATALNKVTSGLSLTPSATSAVAATALNKVTSGLSLTPSATSALVATLQRSALVVEMGSGANLFSATSALVATLQRSALVVEMGSGANLFSATSAVAMPKLFPCRADPAEYYRSVEDGGSISVGAAGGIIGASGLIVDHAGSTTGEVYVEKRAFAHQGYRLYLAFDPAGIAFADGEKHRIVSGINHETLVEAFRIEWVWHSADGGTWEMQFRYATDGGFGAHGIIDIDPANAPFEMEVWQTRGTAAETGMRVWGNGLWTDAEDYTDTITGSATIFRFGVNATAENTVPHIFYLDEATLTDTPAVPIGPFLADGEVVHFPPVAVSSAASFTIISNFTRSLSMQAPSVSTVVSAHNFIKDGSATIIGASATASALNKVANLTADVTAALAADATLNRVGNFIAVVTALSAATSRLNKTTTNSLLTVVSSALALEPQLNAIRKFSLAVAAVCSVAAELTNKFVNFTCLISAASAVAARLNKDADLQTAIAIASTVVPILQRQANLSLATSSALTSSVGDLNVTRRFVLLVTALSSATAVLNKTAGSMTVTVNANGSVSAIISGDSASTTGMAAGWNVPSLEVGWDIPSKNPFNVPGVTGDWIL